MGLVLEYTEAIIVEDGILCHGESRNIIYMVGAVQANLQILVQAWMFRLAEKSLLDRLDNAVNAEKTLRFLIFTTLVAGLITGLGRVEVK
jgi:hypothetical protein